MATSTSTRRKSKRIDVHSHVVPKEMLDALTHDTRALRYLIDLVGADRVVIGTDSPFDMGEAHPVEMINKVKGLSAKDREQIFSKTALRLIGKRG